jgi:hypothetical protein
MKPLQGFSSPVGSSVEGYALDLRYRNPLGFRGSYSKDASSRLQRSRIPQCIMKPSCATAIPLLTEQFMHCGFLVANFGLGRGVILRASLECVHSHSSFCILRSSFCKALKGPYISRCSHGGQNQQYRSAFSILHSSFSILHSVKP